MACTVESESRASSRSTARRSSRTRSKTSFAVATACVLTCLRALPQKPFPVAWLSVLAGSYRKTLYVVYLVRREMPQHCCNGSICPVIRKLQVEAEVVAAQQGNGVLERVPVLAADAHGFP